MIEHLEELVLHLPDHPRDAREREHPVVGRPRELLRHAVGEAEETRHPEAREHGLLGERTPALAVLEEREEQPGLGVGQHQNVGSQCHAWVQLCAVVLDQRRAGEAPEASVEVLEHCAWHALLAVGAKVDHDRRAHLDREILDERAVALSARLAGRGRVPALVGPPPEASARLVEFLLPLDSDVALFLVSFCHWPVPIDRQESL